MPYQFRDDAQRGRFIAMKARKAAKPGDNGGPHFRFLADLINDGIDYEPLVQSERMSVRGMVGVLV